MSTLTSNHEIYLSYLRIIREAKHELFIASPYLDLSEEILKLIQQARERGVNIVLVFRNGAAARDKLAGIIGLNFCINNNFHSRVCFNENMLLVSSNEFIRSDRIIEEIGHLIIGDSSDFLKIKYELYQLLNKQIDKISTPAVLGLCISNARIIADSIFMEKGAYKFSENISTLLMKALTENSDIIEKIYGKIKDDMDKKHKEIMGRFDSLDRKMDEVLEILENTQKEIATIKNSQREDDEKFIRIYSKLDTLADRLDANGKDICEYKAIVKSWLDMWERLDEISLSFLVSAEIIYDEVEKLSNVDYSPFIIQYCRALENEILKKLFALYHENFYTNLDLNADIIEEALKNRDTETFAKNLKYNKKTYTLGQMIWVMRLLKKQDPELQKLVLLSDFREFAYRYFRETIYDDGFQKQLATILNDFRNKAAHPHIMNEEPAMECRSVVRSALRELLENYIMEYS